MIFNSSVKLSNDFQLLLPPLLTKILHCKCLTIIEILIFLPGANMRMTGKGLEADQDQEQLGKDHPRAV